MQRKTPAPISQAKSMVLTTFSGTQRPATYMGCCVSVKERHQDRLVKACDVAHRHGIGCEREARDKFAENNSKQKRDEQFHGAFRF
jgi:hypothetical protein